MRSVYINNIAKHLPNDPVSGDEIEERLGYVFDQPARSRRIVLRSNGIINRYYAIDKNGEFTDTSAGMAAKAIRGLENENFSVDMIDLIATGTSSPDQMLPSHASMVHGELKAQPAETNSFMGACVTGMQALKNAYLAVATGDKDHAIAVASERCSAGLHANNFKCEAENIKRLEQSPILAFEKEFLRWMLSDGAGAAVLESEPKGDLSLKIEWIDITSYANELDPCMFMGAVQNEETGGLIGYYELTENEWLDQSVFALKQDVRLLRENITKYGAKSLAHVYKKYNLDPEDVTYLLPHLSSEFFRGQLHESFAEIGIDVPDEKWFTNLTQVGNVGSASIYLMLEELFNSGKLKKGDKILLCVPESSRFIYAYSLLTVC